MKLSKNQKTLFSLASIAVIILILLLLPHYNNKKEDAYIPNYAVRRIPAPTPTPSPAKIVNVKSQQPGNKILIDSANPEVPIYINIKYEGNVIGTSSLIDKTTNNLEIDLLKTTKEGDILTTEVIDQKNNFLESDDVLITTTAVHSGLILPKDLQN